MVRNGLWLVRFAERLLWFLICYVEVFDWIVLNRLDENHMQHFMEQRQNLGQLKILIAIRRERKMRREQASWRLDCNTICFDHKLFISFKNSSITSIQSKYHALQSGPKVSLTKLFQVGIVNLLISTFRFGISFTSMETRSTVNETEWSITFKRVLFES